MSTNVRDVIETNPWTGIDAHPLPGSGDSPALEILAQQAKDSTEESEPIGVEVLKLRSHTRGGRLPGETVAAADDARAADGIISGEGEDFTDATSILKQRSRAPGGRLPGDGGGR